MDAFLAEVQAAQDDILGADRARAEAARELAGNDCASRTVDAIASEADHLLAESSGVGASGGWLTTAAAARAISRVHATIRSGYVRHARSGA